MDAHEIDRCLKKLGQAYDALGGPPLTLQICGGAALAVLGLVDRTTRDIDLAGPTKLPPEFDRSVAIVARELCLPPDWINQGPVELSKMGLPDGFDQRATARAYGPRIVARFASRIDQIYFKVYAAADRGGYHVDDLMALAPATDEIVDAARWCMTHDVSPAFAEVLDSMCKQLGFADAARKISEGRR